MRYQIAAKETDSRQAQASEEDIQACCAMQRDSTTDTVVSPGGNWAGGRHDEKGLFGRAELE